MPARKIARPVHEAARDKARAIAKTEAYAVSCRELKKVEMLFVILKLLGWVDCASVVETERKTSSDQPPQPKISGTGEAHSAPDAHLRNMRWRARKSAALQRYKSKVRAPQQGVLQQNRRKRS